MQNPLSWIRTKVTQDAERLVERAYHKIQQRKKEDCAGNGIERHVETNLSQSAQLTESPKTGLNSGAQADDTKNLETGSRKHAKTVAETRMSEDGSPTLPSLHARKDRKNLEPSQQNHSDQEILH